MTNPFGLPEYEEYDSELWEYAKELRLCVFLHKKDTAKYVGVHHTTISHYDGDSQNPIPAPPGYLASLACALVDKTQNYQNVEKLKEFLLREINIVRRHNSARKQYADMPPSFQHWDELERFADDYRKKNKAKNCTKNSG